MIQNYRKRYPDLEKDCAQQNVTRQDIPRHDAGEEVDVTFHRQKDQHEADSADHETIPARAKRTFGNGLCRLKSGLWNYFRKRWVVLHQL